MPAALKGVVGFLNNIKNTAVLLSFIKNDDNINL
jgi:hypothetical protein